VLTAVLADATNLDLTRMAEACSVTSYRQLAWSAAWHLREETYRQARAVLVNAHYGREVSALCYTHLSARQAPYHTAAIPPSGEAAYVIDGLLYHEADLSIATHHTDGGGVSDRTFALAHLLGFRFAPRIPNLADRRLYTFGPTGFHRRPRRRKADHGSLAGCPAPGGIGAHRDGQRFAPPQAPQCLPKTERAGAGLARNRPHRAHTVHSGLAGDAGTPAPDHG
jgi:hypothetical protein